MLKIISGGIVKCHADTKKVKNISSGNYIYFVLDGKGSCGKSKIGKGDGFMVKKDGFIDYSSSSDAPLTYAYFALETDELVFEENSLFSVTDESSALRIITSLFNGNEYVSLGQEFDESAARLLFSLIKLSKNASERPRSGKQHVDAAIKYINDNYNREIRVEKIAEELGVDRKYLRNLFSEHLCMSTMDYIMSTRMQRAKELLESSDSSISLVASSVGYRDVLCFSKAFKAHTGMSPTEYREERKTEAAKRARKQKQVPVFIL